MQRDSPERRAREAHTIWRRQAASQSKQLAYHVFGIGKCTNIQSTTYGIATRLIEKSL